MTNADLLQRTDRGLYCPEGDFYIDPWEAVNRAVITHAHADHARPGSRHYLTTRAGAQLLRLRMGDEPTVQSVAYGEDLVHNGVRVSLHPAGHILGSAQIRIEFRGEVWVVSGDYKLARDPTCEPFAPIRCHTFVTESTFGLPIYRWPASADVLTAIHAWWRGNQDIGKASLLFGYALGKAQRLLASLDSSIGPIYTHGAVEKVTAAYRASGVALPATIPVATAARDTAWDRALIIGPPSAHGSPWTRKFGHASTAFASGWMRIRGTRRRRAIDRGFVLSDHADWPGLLEAVRATGAQRVWVTHGYSLVLACWLRAQGLDAEVVQTRFEGERDEAPGDTPAEGGEA